jgi:hypothetical protein
LLLTPVQILWLALPHCSFVPKHFLASVNNYLELCGGEYHEVGNASEIAEVWEQPLVTHITDTTKTMSLKGLMHCLPPLLGQSMLFGLKLSIGLAQQCLTLPTGCLKLNLTEWLTVLIRDIP